MLKTRVQSTLSKKRSKPHCFICHETKGLIRFSSSYKKGRLCRKCLRDGISRTDYY